MLFWEGETTMDFIGISLVTDDVPALTEFYRRVTGFAFVGDAVHSRSPIRRRFALYLLTRRVGGSAGMGYSGGSAWRYG